MINLAAQRGVQVIRGVAEQLPLQSNAFEFALMVTTLCFLDDVYVAFREVHRVLRPGGAVLVGFVDAGSSFGQKYQASKHVSAFYNVADFFSVDDVVVRLQRGGFKDLAFRQTVFGEPGAVKGADPVREGFGQGAFVVVRGTKAGR
jgi:SAM-dependent methyltransferase